MLDTVVYYLVGAIAVLCCLLVVTRKNPIYSAVFMVGFFIMIALNFLILRAPFLAIIQLLVYGGAIMVLYLFVIMLLNLKFDEVKEEITVNRKIFAAVASLGLFLLLAWAIRSSEKIRNLPSLTDPLAQGRQEVVGAGSVSAIANELFRSHGLAFELTSVLILIAIIGAIYLTKKRKNVSHDGTQPG